MVATESSMLEIIRKLGDATPAPVHLSRLLQSPLQDHFSFALSSENRAVAVRVFELLAEASANLRFISEHLGERSKVRIQFCADAEARREVLGVFQTEEISRAIEEFHHRNGVVILSLYPFNGQPQIAERIFAVLRQQGIEILGVNTATSVFSCIVANSDMEAVMSNLKKVFVWQ